MVQFPALSSTAFRVNLPWKGSAAVRPPEQANVI
jgi:hypothetical protein